MEPWVSLSVKAKDGEFQEFDAKIDSGASMTFLGYDDCAILGYVNEKGEMEGKKKTLVAIDKHDLNTHVIPLDVKIGDKTFYSVRVAFWDEKIEADRVVGRSDIFSQVQVALRQKIGYSFFTEET